MWGGSRWRECEGVKSVKNWKVLKQPRVEDVQGGWAAHAEGVWECPDKVKRGVGQGGGSVRGCRV